VENASDNNGVHERRQWRMLVAPVAMANVSVGDGKLEQWQWRTLAMENATRPRALAENLSGTATPVENVSSAVVCDSSVSFTFHSTLSYFTHSLTYMFLGRTRH